MPYSEVKMNKIVIITGGANGLGLELARKCAACGYNVCIVDIDSKATQKAKDELSCEAFVGNIACPELASAVISELTQKGYEVYALFNNGGAPSFKAPTEYTSADVERCLEGLKGMIYFTTAVLNGKKSSSETKIINIMSSAALRGNANESVYCATKWGERGYTESLKKAYEGTNTRIYGIYPGGIDTDFYKDQRHYVSLEKQHTFMSPVDLAEVIVDNVFSSKHLVIEDLVINRIK